MQALSPKQKKQLLKAAHNLRPVVMIGNKGLTDAVAIEIDHAFQAHELIKIKIAGADRDERGAMLQEISEDHDAALVQKIGCIGIFYKPNQEK